MIGKLGMSQELKDEIINIAIQIYKNKIKLDNHCILAKSKTIDVKESNKIFTTLFAESANLYDSFYENIEELING